MPDPASLTTLSAPLPTQVPMGNPPDGRYAKGHAFASVLSRLFVPSYGGPASNIRAWAQAFLPGTVASETAKVSVKPIPVATRLALELGNDLKRQARNERELFKRTKERVRPSHLRQVLIGVAVVGTLLSAVALLMTGIGFFGFVCMAIIGIAALVGTINHVAGRHTDAATFRLQMAEDQRVVSESAGKLGARLYQLWKAEGDNAQVDRDHVQAVLKTICGKRGDSTLAFLREPDATEEVFIERARWALLLVILS